MKKLLFFIFVMMIVSISACKQAVKEQIKKEDVIIQESQIEVGTTGEAVVDAVGNDLNSIQSVEKDLGTEDLNELDSGLQDIENI